MRTYLLLTLVILFCFNIYACDRKASNGEKSLMAIDIESVANKTGLKEVEIDTGVYADGSESLKITTDKSLVIQLANTGDIDVEDALLLYRGKIKTQDVEGKVFLEMWCSFGEKGQYFSKAIENALTGTNDWTVQETPFFLKKGENPDDIKLNVVIDGKGTVWIDQIELLERPLN